MNIYKSSKLYNHSVMVKNGVLSIKVYRPKSPQTPFILFVDIPTLISSEKGVLDFETEQIVNTYWEFQPPRQLIVLGLDDDRYDFHGKSLLL